MAKQVKKYTSKKAVKSVKPVAKKVVAKKAPAKKVAPVCNYTSVSTKPAKKSIFAKIKSIFGF